MGTNSIQAKVADGWKLLETRKKQLESAQEQTKAVQAEYSKIQKEKGNAEQLDAKLAQKVMILSNFNVKAEPKEPNKVEDPGSAPNIPAEASEKEKGIINNEFEQKKADFKQYQEDVKQYEKDLKEFKKYEALKDEIEKESPEIKGQLDTLMKAAQAKEDELKQAKNGETELQREFDFSWDNYQELQKELETAKFDVTLNKQGDNLTSVAKENINKTSIDGKEADVKAVYDGIVAGDTENKVDNTKKHYTTMKVGDKHTYNKDQIAKMGADVNLTDDFGEDFGTQMNNLLEDAVKEKPDQKPEGTEVDSGDKPAKPDQKPVKSKDKIIFPRGIQWQGTEGNKLSDFGLTDNGDGTYKASTGKTYTAAEVNKYFREIEDSSGNNYSKYLDKAEKLGIKYDGLSPKELKETVKAAEKGLKAKEKRSKVVDKYAHEINEYGININGRSANDIKALVKAAKAKAIETTNTSTKVEVQKAESAPKKDQPAVKAEAETKTDAKTRLKAIKEQQLANLSENERKKYDEIMADTDFFTGGQARADIYLTRVSAYQEGSRYKVTDPNGVQSSYTARLTNKGEKVFEQNGVFYEIGKDGFPDKSKTVKKEDIKPFS